MKTVYLINHKTINITAKYLEFV